MGISTSQRNPFHFKITFFSFVQNGIGKILTLIDNSVSGMESVSEASMHVHPRLHTDPMMGPVTTWKTRSGVGPNRGLCRVPDLETEANKDSH